MRNFPAESSRDNNGSREGVEPKNFYEILGVARTSSKAEINDAFRRIASQYHPDRNKSQEAEGVFKDASEAYAVLSDDEKRALYDALGPERYNDPREVYRYRLQREEDAQMVKDWEARRWEQKAEAIGTIIGSVFFLFVLDEMIPSYVFGPWNYVFNGFAILCLIVGIQELFED